MESYVSVSMIFLHITTFYRCSDLRHGEQGDLQNDGHD